MLLALAALLEIDRRWIKHQGGFEDQKEDAVPDNYTRQAQLLAMRLQVRCIEHLRRGLGMLSLRATPLVDSPPVVQQVLPQTEPQGGTPSAEQVAALDLNEETGSSESECGEDLIPQIDLEDSPQPARQFMINTNTGCYHLVDFTASVIDQDKWKLHCHRRRT